MGMGIVNAMGTTQAITNSHVTTVYTNSKFHTTTAIQATVDGVQQAILLNSKAASPKFNISFRLPKGAKLVSNNAGGYNVIIMNSLSGVTSAGESFSGITSTVQIASINAPWAKDATGKALPTYFKYNGNSLTQVIKTKGATYPITADPKVKWVHWHEPELLFNHTETGRGRNRGYLLGLAGMICAAVAAESFGTLAGGCCVFAAEVITISSVASNAYFDGRCLALRYGFVSFSVNCKTRK